jgi:hypothetical protein
MWYQQERGMRVRTWRFVELLLCTTSNQGKRTSTTHVATNNYTFLCPIYHKRPVLVILGAITKELKNTRTISSFSYHLMYRIPAMREEGNIQSSCYDTEGRIEGVLQQLTKPLSKRPSFAPSSSKGQFLSSLGSMPSKKSEWSATSPAVWLIDYQQWEKRTWNFI